MTHAVLGIIATAGGILQLLLMILMRPPKPGAIDHDYHAWPLWQKVGHFSHRGLGFLWMLLAFAALETGTHITSVNRQGYEDLTNQNEKWSGAFLGTTFATVLTTAAIVLVIPRLVSPPIVGASDDKPESANMKGPVVDEEKEEVANTA
jgi:hypothetical protein